MRVDERISAFSMLGKELSSLDEDTFQSLAFRAKNENAWFTVDSVRMAVRGITSWLDAGKLLAWTSGYNLNVAPCTIAIVMAGNLPLVGFHDFLCVLIAGHKVMIKTSSKDTVLIKYIIDALVRIEPRFSDRIIVAEQLKGFDAIIATGSDNTSRYFEYYFAKYPHIIRRNRTSVAVINGSESSDELAALGTDVFSYFGLGCRNVGKAFLPKGYEAQKLLESWSTHQDIVHHHKYCNNYDYQKSVLLVAQLPFLDSGFVMLQPNERLFSPLSVVYYEFYDDDDSLAKKLLAFEDKIQCIVSKNGEIKFGQSQFPSLSDYADRIDTMSFVTSSILAVKSK
ncbi:acyl-CoA reductase [Chryseolinea sp. T2]|uniref:acyl-CoA reductase n=1 Tax=Chryseolinea sp. T2 TaxID=3129255 RepID=UPI003078379B